MGNLFTKGEFKELVGLVRENPELVRGLVEDVRDDVEVLLPVVEELVDVVANALTPVGSAIDVFVDRTDRRSVERFKNFVADGMTREEAMILLTYNRHPRRSNDSPYLQSSPEKKQ